MVELCKMKFSFLLAFSFLVLNCFSDVCVTTGMIVKKIKPTQPQLHHHVMSWQIYRWDVLTNFYWAHICSELKVSFGLVSDELMTWWKTTEVKDKNHSLPYLSSRFSSRFFLYMLCFGAVVVTIINIFCHQQSVINFSHWRTRGNLRALT